VSGQRGNHVACYCDDCQAFAWYLERSDELLDPNGGSQIFQPVPIDLSFESGVEQIACVRFTPKGILRWYAQCCRMPLANTMATNRIPFVRVLRSKLCGTGNRPADAGARCRRAARTRATARRRLTAEALQSTFREAPRTCRLRRRATRGTACRVHESSKGPR